MGVAYMCPEIRIGRKQKMERHNDAIIGQLTAQVQVLTVEVSRLRERMEDMQAKLNTGRGMLISVLMVAGGAGAALTEVFGRFFK